MRRFVKTSLAASLCVAMAAMFAPQTAHSQVRFYAGPGGVGGGYGNYGPLNYGAYGPGYRGGYYNNYGNRYYGGRYNDGWNNYGNRWDRGYGYGNQGRYYQSYTPRSYSYQGQPRYYQGQRYYQAQPRSYQGNQSHYITRQENQNPDRPVMGVRILSAGDAVRVVTVQPNSPAADAGLQEGDLITSFNGKAVTTERALLSELDRLEPNAEVQLTVRSGDRTWDTSMQLTTYREAFSNNVAHEGERRTVGRPMLDDDRSPADMQRERDMLRREGQQLRDSGQPSLRNDSDVQGTLDADIDIPAPPLEGEANLDSTITPDAGANNIQPDVSADADVNADVNAGTQPGAADANADADAGTQPGAADANADVDANTGADTNLQPGAADVEADGAVEINGT